MVPLARLRSCSTSLSPLMISCVSAVSIESGSPCGGSWLSVSALVAYLRKRIAYFSAWHFFSNCWLIVVKPSRVRTKPPPETKVAKLTNEVAPVFSFVPPIDHWPAWPRPDRRAPLRSRRWRYCCGSRAMIGRLGEPNYWSVPRVGKFP